MDALANIFSTDNETIEKLKSYASQPDYNKALFGHLGPELRKIFDTKKDNTIYKNFLEGAQYEYGFFNTQIDLQKAFSIYKKYADLNDYLCMYKMHVIYLCEYDKFNVTLNRVLEKIYLLKSFAYVPNYLLDWELKFFDVIDIKYEIAQILDLEDGNLEKHPLFFDLLNYQREKYNLTENDINLMKGVFSCYFNKNEDLNMISFAMLNSLVPKGELDLAYYHSKNKCIYLQTYLKLDKIISDSEIEKFYKEIEEKKLYEFYCDYSNYLLDEKIKANQEVIQLFSTAAEKGYLFACFRIFQCLIDYYDFDEIMNDYDISSTLLNSLLDQIVFENLEFRRFILLMGFLYKYSKFSEKIMSKYLVYVKEINDNFNSILNKKEQENTITEEDDYYYAIKAYLYYFGFPGIEEQNYPKAIEYLDKASNLTSKTNNRKNNNFMIYNIKKTMYNIKLITDDELFQAKKNLIEFFSDKLSWKYEVVDSYVIGLDYLEGITQKKDETSALFIFDSTKKIFCKNTPDCFFKTEMKKIVAAHGGKLEYKYKDEICSICYTNKVDKIFIPCKHNFCSFCTKKLETDAKCPMCRSKIITII